MLSWLRRLFRRRRVLPPTVGLTPTGFALTDPDGGAVAVDWPQVRRVFAYKRDLYTADCIMLAFERDGATPALIEVAESWPGFSQLFEAMESALGVSPAWYVEIMTPAFETTPLLLYERDAAPARAAPGEAQP